MHSVDTWDLPEPGSSEQDLELQSYGQLSLVVPSEGGLQLQGSFFVVHCICIWREKYM